MHLDDILNLLSRVDYELQELEKQRTIAQSAANAAEVSRLEAEISRLTKVRNELRERWKSERAD